MCSCFVSRIFWEQCANHWLHISYWVRDSYHKTEYILIVRLMIVAIKVGRNVFCFWITLKMQWDIYANDNICYLFYSHLFLTSTGLWFSKSHSYSITTFHSPMVLQLSLMKLSKLNTVISLLSKEKKKFHFSLHIKNSWL